jgi:hypothetical protein
VGIFRANLARFLAYDHHLIKRSPDGLACATNFFIFVRRDKPGHASAARFFRTSYRWAKKAGRVGTLQQIVWCRRRNGFLQIKTTGCRN